MILKIIPFYLSHTKHLHRIHRNDRKSHDYTRLNIAMKIPKKQIPT